MSLLSLIIGCAVIFGLTASIATLAALRAQFGHATAGTPARVNPSLLLAIDIGACLLLGIGAISLAAVPALYRFIHGSRERFEWIISGPSPFNQFGGGPYQTFLYGGLAVAGVGMIITGLWLRLALRKHQNTDGIAASPTAPPVIS